MPKRPLLPVWEKGAGGMRGNRASERPNAPTPALGARTPKRPLLPVWEKGVGGMKGNRASERPNAPCAGVGHQNAQTPPSPRVGEGGRGDEGQKARECSTPRIASRTIPLRGECSSPSVRILHLCGATESPPGAPGAVSGTGRSGHERDDARVCAYVPEQNPLSSGAGNCLTMRSRLSLSWAQRPYAM